MQRGAMQLRTQRKQSAALNGEDGARATGSRSWEQKACTAVTITPARATLTARMKNVWASSYQGCSTIRSPKPFSQQLTLRYLLSTGGDIRTSPTRGYERADIKMNPKALKRENPAPAKSSSLATRILARKSLVPVICARQRSEPGVDFHHGR